MRLKLSFTLLMLSFLIVATFTTVSALTETVGGPASETQEDSLVFIKYVTPKTQSLSIRDSLPNGKVVEKLKKGEELEILLESETGYKTEKGWVTNNEKFVAVRVDTIRVEKPKPLTPPPPEPTYWERNWKPIAGLIAAVVLLIALSIYAWKSNS